MDWFPVLILIPSSLAFFNASSLKWFGNNHNVDPESGGQLNVNVVEGKELVLEGKTAQQDPMLPSNLTLRYLERRHLERLLHHETGSPQGFLDRAKSVFGVSHPKGKRACIFR
jgi:hypothetical protein